jgi:hypothetical protein
VRSWKVLALCALLAGCGHAQPTAIGNATDPDGDEAAIECDDELVGPLHLIPDASYLIAESELAQRTIREHRGELLRCYTDRARRYPSLAGRVTVEFRIDAEGRARGIRTQGFDAVIDRCLCERIAKLQFEKRAFDASVTVPLTFAGSR